ncbi:hypothetical protein [Nannocystis pusilla]|uniref:hypothetical protein n=1 Tax=Nannocystis pusilla TaxID=889268 RepID=UPI003B7872C0
MWKKLAIVLLVLLLLAGGVVTYLWLQVTALPDWYTELAQEDAPAAVEDASGKLQWQPTEGKAGRRSCATSTARPLARRRRSKR